MGRILPRLGKNDMNYVKDPETRALLEGTLILGNPPTSVDKAGEAVSALVKRTPLNPHNCPSCVMTNYVVLGDRVGDYYTCAIHGDRVRFGPDSVDILKVGEGEQTEIPGYRANGITRGTVSKSGIALWPPEGSWEEEWVEGVRESCPRDRDNDREGISLAKFFLGTLFVVVVLFCLSFLISNC